MSHPAPAEVSNDLSPMTPTEWQMHEDLQWAMAHHGELEPHYRGEFVVVWQKQVIGHGTDEEELLRQAASAERPREQLVVVEFPANLDSLR